MEAVDGQIVKVETAVVPAEAYRMATDVAGLCREIVTKTAKQIQRRKYVCVEGWQAIAAAHGCILSIESVAEDADGNVTSVAGVRRMHDGALLGKAEGFVGMDESTWKSRARYARRAMAQTRAMSRAARSAFAHVVVLIDAGLSTTPAEEVPDGGFHDEPTPAEAVRRHVESHSPPDPLADNHTFKAKVDEAFKARGFTPDQADDAIGDWKAGHGWKHAIEASVTQRIGFIADINAGKFDTYKQAATAAGK